MKCLFIADNKDLQELVTFQITSKFPITVKESTSPRDGFEWIKKDEKAFDLLISPYYGPESVLMKILRERKTPLPVIFYYDPLILDPSASNLNGIKCLGIVESSKLVDGISDLIKKFIEDSGGAEDINEFCPIRTTLLIRVGNLKSDIYIKLSEKKFVKLFHTGTSFGKEDLEKYYQSKGVEYMYLRRNETSDFMKHFKEDLDALLSKKEVDPDEVMQVVEFSQETIQNLIHNIGFTPEVQELAKKNVELTLKALGKNPKLTNLLDKIKKDGNYLHQHSTLLANVACCVAKEMEWGSEASFSKLVLAAYMHDISLTNPEIAKISTLKELEQKKKQFKKDEVESYHLHPAKSADVVRSFQEIPADVDSIVLQHHERPNGGGFPRGLSHNYIAPLAVLFIICHDMVQDMLLQQGKFSLQDYVQAKKPFYNQGNFKKVMTVLEKINM